MLTELQENMKRTKRNHEKHEKKIRISTEIRSQKGAKQKFWSLKIQYLIQKFY